jgi:hypothetical protein
MSGCKSELLHFLSQNPKPLNVVVMPDFFMDRIINLNYNVQQFTSALGDVFNRKGGSIDQISQTDLRGGNALNVASALLALSIKVKPIICTSKLGLEQIRFHLREFVTSRFILRHQLPQRLSSKLQERRTTSCSEILGPSLISDPRT